ncbi:MAG TPA: SPFH domain-containing protein [Vicinamibacterales bacterium]|nr:SPFH domain-containing protein [Vicinamibacterales bacterium]
MNPALEFLLAFWWLILIVILFAAYKLVLRLFGVIIIPQDSIGIVDKKYVLVGSNRTLPDGRIVALNGEAGIQADTLAPGIHYFKWPWQFEVRVVKFTTIEEGSVGVVEASDGNPLVAGRVLAHKVDCDSFQNARAFLSKGGERGPQITVIPPGTYRINRALFSVETVDVLEINDNKVGIVTTREGQPLVTGEIAGKEIPNHSLFQDGQAFIDGGGFKGLQEQVMLAGRYFINPRFATVEIKDMTVVPIANVGVVIAYVGGAGVDLSGDKFKHGNLVSRGQKGVWAEALDPGKYPINPYTHKVEIVPTANVVLNWATTKSEAHMLDERLSSITVRSSDGFPYNLDVSQIIHIPRTDAPKVIARFGSVANLVTQVLEPTIGNYFRNAAQGSDVIDFLKNRVQRQEEARAAISSALDEYNVGAVNTLIGDIAPPEQLMKTLTDRKLAEQERITYGTQREAEEVRKSLQQATAQADTQPGVVRAERDVEIAEFNAKASVKKAEGDAKSKTINADADARVTQLNGDADAGKIRAIGTSEADVIKLKIASMESGNYALIETARALAGSGFKLVPDIVAGGSDGMQGGSLVSVLLANLVADHARKNAERLGPGAAAGDAKPMLPES